MSAYSEHIWYALLIAEPGCLRVLECQTPHGNGVVIFTSRARALAFRASVPPLAKYEMQRFPGPQLLAMLRNRLLAGLQVVVCDPESQWPDRLDLEYTPIVKFLADAEDVEGQS
jgi:hypothetical protein